VENGDRVVARTGRGLGLTFCKLAVEAHGGRIWVEDGRPGAVFCMRIPNGR
jgi:signal transduction histidine kinase